MGRREVTNQLTNSLQSEISHEIGVSSEVATGLPSTRLEAGSVLIDRPLRTIRQLCEPRR